VNSTLKNFPVDVMSTCSSLKCPNISDETGDFSKYIYYEILDYIKMTPYLFCFRVPVTARSKAWVSGRSLASIAGSNPAGIMDVFLL